MRLKNLNDVMIDLDKVSYIGKPDVHIKHQGTSNQIINFFLIVVDGYPIEIKAETKDELIQLRDHLITIMPF